VRMLREKIVDRSGAGFLHARDYEIYLVNLAAMKMPPTHRIRRGCWSSIAVRFHVQNSTTFRTTRKLDRQFARND